ncbi:CRISPR-associated endonuclease Cas2 [Aliarcobacter cryaerophilus]|jgi:CRISPR-associated protein Cas2|uniref:CRISPR-associated endoribonuclease Cas2 n=1 Tax=Arcobacter sp. AZ-2023 TaxID=3074453 RepID=A0AA96DMT7_9BACT|nr:MULTISPECIES: CRISPR-associated endonuclease Cas2 [Aliarcobacter]WNL30477.1 CRISPR-associated endonuclease Cas2 [Arcobacter sp. AZ-2023]MCT7486168.1 CRISPR-associated endonuclease Cas2 [Aliarcobacter cryaerophilus]MCT7491642.1 CRISPR-associated endonuclease Cas2 [Aliarcobacter cryaerophilus]MCT7519231.1 CRISPR-associated endonuclease Cas2 [Aliarcobacter cryaerophilus]MCT7529418.1 CRISPR-associated endonuclease Cas2 [Aliarcobacter cryaerophilus]
MKYLITYDIENNKRRKKVSDELEAYGYRVNFSVFECELNKTKMKNLVKKLEELIDKKKDSLRFYHVCENCVPKSFELCNREEIFEKREYFI